MTTYGPAPIKFTRLDTGLYVVTLHNRTRARVEHELNHWTVKAGDHHAIFPTMAAAKQHAIAYVTEHPERWTAL
jgi:hypothetical protein